MHHSVTQCTQVPEADEIGLAAVLDFDTVEPLNGNVQMFDTLFRLTFFEAGDGVAKVCLQTFRVDPHRNLVPLAGCVESVLLLVLCGQVDHRKYVLRI